MKLTLMLMVILTAGLVSLGSAGRRSIIAGRPASKEMTTLSLVCNSRRLLTGSKGESVQIDLFLNNPHREQQLLCTSKCKIQFGMYLHCRDHFVTANNITVQKAEAKTFLLFTMRYVLEAPLYHLYSKYRVVLKRQQDGKPTTLKADCNVYQGLVK